MIKIPTGQDCCGCGACQQACPKRCISMKEDLEGFLYPEVAAALCIDCGLCGKVCPVLNQNKPGQPLKVYAAKNPDEEIRRKSSSGGAFTMLAERVIEEGGIVFGAKFNESWEVVHDYSETKEGLAAFRGSKYIQSIVGDTYREAESFLKRGRKVLYSGTPCQIAGLKRYLRKEYDNLLTVDFICHGVPSPGVFRWYLGETFAGLARKGEKYSFAFRPIPHIPKADVLAAECGYTIEDIRFRDKKLGWKKFSFALDLSEASAEGKKNSVSLSEPLNKNHFLRGFLADLYLRPSCHACPAKELKSGSDITLGDWWGIQNEMPEYDDDKGVSVICVNTEKGSKVFQEVRPVLTDSVFQTVVRYNPSLMRSSKRPDERKAFYKEDGRSFFEKTDELCHPSLSLRMHRKIGTIVRKIIGIQGKETFRRVAGHLKGIK